MIDAFNTTRTQMLYSTKSCVILLFGVPALWNANPITPGLMNSIIFKLASPQASSLTLAHFRSLQTLGTFNLSCQNNIFWCLCVFVAVSL